MKGPVLKGRKLTAGFVVLNDRADHCRRVGRTRQWRARAVLVAPADSLHGRQRTRQTRGAVPWVPYELRYNRTLSLCPRPCLTTHSGWCSCCTSC